MNFLAISQIGKESKSDFFGGEEGGGGGCQNSIDPSISDSCCKTKSVFYISQYLSSKKWFPNILFGLVQLPGGHVIGMTSY